MARPIFNSRAKAQLREITNGFVASNSTTVQIARKTGHDRNGDTYTDPVGHEAEVFWKQIVVTDNTGKQRVSRGFILFPFPPPDVDLDDLITLPDNSQPPIISVEKDGNPTDPMIPTRVFF